MLWRRASVVRISLVSIAFESVVHPIPNPLSVYRGGPDLLFAHSRVDIHRLVLSVLQAVMPWSAMLLQVRWCTAVALYRFEAVGSSRTC